MKYLIAGPSHTARWWQRIHWKQFPKPKSMCHIYYGPGEALFSKKMYEDIKKHAKNVDMIYLFVPDFRFGNNIFEQYDEFPSLFIEGFTHPHKEYVNDVNDLKMYTHGLKVLDAYQKEFRNKIKFIFWCMNYREAMNIKKNKYINLNGEYQHPLWNLKELYNRYKDNAINLTEVQNRIQEFTLDEQGHPSLKAYSFLAHLFRSNSVKKALEIVDTSYDAITELLFCESEEDLFYLKSKIDKFHIEKSYEDKLFDKGLIAYQNLEFKTALNIFNDSLIYESNDKNKADIYFRLALCYMQLKNYLMAEFIFKIAISLDEKKSSYMTQLGVLYKKKGDLLKSKECFLKALSIEPNDVGAKKEYSIITMEK